LWTAVYSWQFSATRFGLENGRRDAHPPKCAAAQGAQGEMAIQDKSAGADPSVLSLYEEFH